jgi:hypothetical protein
LVIGVNRWCDFGATLYRARLTIFTIFTLSNGTLKTPRDNYSLLAIISIHKKLCITQSFLCYVVVQFVKLHAVVFAFWGFYDIIILDSFLLDKLEFDE